MSAATAAQLVREFGEPSAMNPDDRTDAVLAARGHPAPHRLSPGARRARILAPGRAAAPRSRRAARGIAASRPHHGRSLPL
jgi:hypothetical protein